MKVQHPQAKETVTDPRHRAELEAEIDLLERRLQRFDELGDSSYERRLVQAYQDMLVDRRRRLGLTAAA
jgi:hypothetical protein